MLGSLMLRIVLPLAVLLLAIFVVPRGAADDFHARTLSMKWEGQPLKRKDTVEVLRALACNQLSLDKVTRRHALILAGAIMYNDRAEYNRLLRMLEEGGKLPREIDNRSISALVRALEPHLEALSVTPGNGAPGNYLRGFLSKLVLEIDPGNDVALIALGHVHESRREGIEDWNNIRTDGREMEEEITDSEPEEESMSRTWTPATAIEYTDADRIVAEGQESRIRGLLITPLANGKMAGSSSNMNAILMPGTGHPTTLAFNQDVGEMMVGALPEVEKFLALRHKGWIYGQRIEISFEEKNIPKDGDSATVACALLADSIVTGLDLAENFAVTGAMNSQGEVNPIGGVAAKLRGARGKGCTIVAIPYANRYALSDLIVLGETQVLGELGVYLIKTFDEAQVLALGDRDAAAAAAISKFDVFRRAATGKNPIALAQHPKGRALLEEVLAAQPNHASALLLLAAASNRGPKRLSINGSINYISETAGDIITAIDDGNWESSSSLDTDKLGKASGELVRMRTKLDPKATRLCDTLIDFTKSFRKAVAVKTNSRATYERLVGDIQRKGAAVDSAWKELESDPEVIERLQLDD